MKKRSEPARRPEVVSFAREMERRLDAHDHDRGYASWRQLSTPRELEELFVRYAGRLRVALTECSPNAVARNAVNVANVCMMMLDVMGDLDRGNNAVADSDPFEHMPDLQTLHPGDTLVLHLRQRLALPDLERIKAEWGRHIAGRGVKLVLLGSDLTVIDVRRAEEFCEGGGV